MGLTSALFTGLSGLNSNQFRIDVIGDNIANANTVGFKSSRSMFQTQFAQVFTMGTPPGGTQGGTNGIEVGLGSGIGATQRNMMQGSTETTGLATDMAIDGNGFFVVRSSDNRQAYTRDGSFLLNAENYLVTADGFFLQGFGVDENFNIIPGVLTDLQIPLGRMSEARATSAARLSGNLSATSNLIGSQGTSYTSQALVDGGGAAAVAGTALTDLRSASAPGTPLFANGTVITVQDVKKGGRDLPDAQFVVGTTGTTVGDYLNWLNQTLGINTSAGLPGNPGATIAGGQIIINGNVGSENALDLSTSNISSNMAGISQPFTMTKGVDAVGESVYTSFIVYDSLGTPLQVNMTMVLESATTGAKTWRFYAESPDDANGGRAVGTGTLTFDDKGKIVASTGTNLTIDRDNTGAGDPLMFSLDLTSLSGLNTGNVASQLMMTEQTGFPPGTLNSFSVGADGTITGTFTNGLSRTLGQVALATFSNPAGLSRETNNLFRAGPNSGEAVVSAPTVMGTGRIMTGSLELSNVDLSREFIGLINASTGFSAAGKVITTSDKLLNDLLMLTR